MSEPKFLIDECLSPELARRLAARGYDATSVRDRSLLGKSDFSIVSYCIAEDRILVTQNAEDFRKLVGRTEIHPGLITLNANSKEQSWAELEAALQYIEARANPNTHTWMLNRVIEVEGSTVTEFELPLS